jgi:hypothetical protein
MSEASLSLWGDVERGNSSVRCGMAGSEPTGGSSFNHRSWEKEGWP